MLAFIASQLKGLALQFKSSAANPVGHAADGNPGVTLPLGMTQDVPQFATAVRHQDLH
jgi:hypothetical protein